MMQPRRYRTALRGCALLLSLGSLLLSAISAAAQTAPRLGILVQEMGRAQSQAVKGFTDELKRLGYRERQDFFLETRNVKGNRAALQPAAVELVEKNVKLIFTTGTSAPRAAIAATTGIPIVFVHPGNPAASGLLRDGEARPTNLTGVAAYAAQTTERRLLLFKEIVPTLKKIWVFYDGNNAVSREYFKRAEDSAKKMRIEAAGFPIKSGEELKTTMGSLRPENGTGIFQISDEVLESEADFLFQAARAKKIPTMFNEESWAIAGALAAYGPDYLDMGRHAGRLADKILKGAAPRSLQLERASKFDLTLNYRTARFLGIALSPEMLKTAEKVIR